MPKYIKRRKGELGVTAARKRPLVVIEDLAFFKSMMPMKLCHVKEIERRFSSSNYPLHPHLKDLKINVHNAWGTTPLIIACQHGELDSVKYLIETWEVDLRSPANYYSNPPDYYYSWTIGITRATPLFVAALHGHNQIVRYLLEKGADVSAKIPSDGHYPAKFDGMTPLYAAVSSAQYNPRRSILEQQEERHEVVRSLLEFGADPIADSFRPSDGQPMWSEKMCGVNATTVLINHGLDLRLSVSHTGETILHYMAGVPHGFTEEDSLAIVKLLVEKGADLLALDNQRRSTLMKVTDVIYRMHDYETCLNLTVLDYLLDRAEYGPMEKIEAMEFAGASILSHAKYSQHIPKAFEYWRRAHQLREREKEASDPSAGKLLGRKIGRHVEWTTLIELDQIIENPEDYKIQSLLVKLRVISGRIPFGYQYYYSHHNLSSLYMDEVCESAVLDFEEESIMCLDIRWGMLDLVIRRLDPLLTEEVIWIKIEEYVHELVATFEDFYPPLLNFERIKTSLDLILQATNSSPVTITNGEHRTGESLLRFKGTQFTRSLLTLLELIFRLSEIPNENDMYSLTQSLCKLGPRRLGNLLLPACKNLSKFNNLAIVRVLLEAGADPNVAVDEDAGNASLHVVAVLHDQELCEAAGTLLLEQGAHLERLNKAGKTAVDVWIGSRTASE